MFRAAPGLFSFSILILSLMKAGLSCTIFRGGCSCISEASPLHVAHCSVIMSTLSQELKRNSSSLKKAFTGTGGKSEYFVRSEVKSQDPRYHISVLLIDTISQEGLKGTLSNLTETFTLPRGWTCCGSADS